MNKALKSIISWIVYLAVLVALVFGTPKALTYFLHTPYPMASITSGSMWPVLKVGDMVFIEGIKNKDDFKVGDIVVYKNPSASSGQIMGFTIHRVIKKNEDDFITKGDANNIEDQPVKYDEAVGKTLTFHQKPIRIPYLGNISIWLGKKI